MPYPSATLSLFVRTGLAAPVFRVLASTSLPRSNTHTTQNTVREPVWLWSAYSQSQRMHRKLNEMISSGLWECRWLSPRSVCVFLCFLQFGYNTYLIWAKLWGLDMFWPHPIQLTHYLLLLRDSFFLTPPFCPTSLLWQRTPPTPSSSYIIFHLTFLPLTLASKVNFFY